MPDRIEYHGFWIQYDPPSIPVRAFDWQYWHKDYDGPEDNRHGHAPSLEQAKDQIRGYWWSISRLNYYPNRHSFRKWKVSERVDRDGVTFDTQDDAIEYIAAVTSQNPDLVL